MFPSLSKDNGANLLKANPQVFSDAALDFTGGSALPDFSDLLLAQNRIVPIDSFTGPFRVLAESMGVSKVHSSFCYGISDIVSMSAEEQVARANAAPDVAGVANAHACRDGTEVQFPRETMRVDHRRAAFVSASAANATIAGAFVDWALPEPTTFRLLYAWPEALAERNRTSMLIGHRSSLLRCQPPAGINGAGA